MRAAFLALTIFAFLAPTFRPTASAQAPGVPIETQEPVMNDRAILEKAEAARKVEGILTAEKLAEQMKAPLGGDIALVPPQTTPLRGRELAQRGREGYLRMGWNYRCKRCDKWHLQFAGAYAIATDVIVTCHHCLVPDFEMREGYLIAVDSAGNVLPVTEVIAANKELDGAILRVKGAPLKPLALQDNVAPGDSAYCFSEPLGQHGYFSHGIVNRFVWLRGKARTGTSLADVVSLRVNVSTDWAPGSSGAAVLDECGNAIGHVARISPMGKGGRSAPEAPKPDKDAGATPDKTPTRSMPAPRDNTVLITLHEAIPARGMLALAKDAREKKSVKAPAEAVEKSSAPAEKPAP